jgi:leader peptidase (prepilin peptidase) / N-methyltransferase
MSLPPWFILLCLFLLGAIIGSFLNVVVYRLPRGLSLVRPGSQCPNCNHPIRGYDNVPILSWLWLRGRCRDCGTAISYRYPLVELAVGLIFLGLGWTDWVRPQQHALKVAAAEAAVQKVPANGAADADGNPPEATTPALKTEEFVWPLGYHLSLLCVLLAAALIDADGERMPRQLITWPAAVGILIAMFWPAVQVFSLFRFNSNATDGISFVPLANSFVGMLTAVVIRIAVQRFFGVARARELGLWNCTLALYAVGAFLGWQAVLLVAVLAIVWTTVGQLRPLKTALVHVPPTAVVFFATLIWCLTERHLLSGG